MGDEDGHLGRWRGDDGKGEEVGEMERMMMETEEGKDRRRWRRRRADRKGKDREEEMEV